MIFGWDFSAALKNYLDYMRKILPFVLWMGLMAAFHAPAMGQAPDSLNLCAGGNAVSLSPDGVLYDSGGPEGYYNDGEFCSLLINPGCAVSISLFIDYLDTESCCDRLFIYDGPNEHAPLLATLSGYYSGLTYTSTGGTLFLQWNTDGSVVDQGYRLEWASELAPPEQVVAGASASNPAPALQEPVQFSASATNFPVFWSWDFGDGSFSSLQNPAHAYNQPGDYTAQLVVVNCHGLSDTVGVAIQVQGPPALGVGPSSLELTVACGDTAFAAINLANDGQGPLLFQADAVLDYIPRVVVYARNANFDPLNGLLAALPVSGAEHSLRTSMAEDAAGLNADLADADILILPDSYQDIWAIQALAPAVQAFAARGGSVIFLAATYYNSWIEATGLLTAEGYYTQQYSYFNLDFTDGHPLTAGMPDQYFAPTFCGGHRFTDPDYASLCGQNGNSLLGFRRQGQARIIYLGFNFYSYDAVTAQLLGNALNWCRGRRLSAAPGSGQVAVGGSGALSLGVNTAFLPAGTYSGQVILQINDPLHPEATVPFQLQVEGEPQAETETTALVFGITQQYAQVLRQFVLRNTGCDTLHILSAGTGNPYFYLLTYPDVVLPWQELVLKVAFNPQEPGSFNAALAIETDGGLISVQLGGLAVAAPVSSVSPTSLSASLSCEEGFTQTIMLSNTGQGQLNFQAGGAQAPKRVLGLTTGANYWKWNNLRNLMQSSLANLEVREYNGSDPAALADSLAWANILVLPPFDVFSDPAFDFFRPLIQGFLQEGGQVLVMGWYNTNPVSQLLGMLPPFTTNSYFDVEVAVNIPAHAAFEGFGRQFRTADYTYFAGLNIGGLARLAEYDGQLYLGYLPVGMGNVVYWGAALDYATSQNFDLLTNLFQWMANPLPPGLSIEAQSGVLLTGGSQSLTLEFNGQGLPGGLYSGQLRLNTNDPQNNPMIIPIEVEAPFSPCISISYEAAPCSGAVTFSEETINGLNSWYWTFGDGFDSFAANPVHTYADDGAYTATLVGCNDFGCDTASQEIFLDPFDGPVAANCSPQTQDYCCEAGIFRVQLAGIDYASGDASEGYQDLSCLPGANLMAGSQYPIEVTTGNHTDEYVRVWADLNGNGSFSDNELIFSSQAYIAHQGFITIPLNAVRDTPLRLRVVSEPTYYAPPFSCGPINRGQVEDYQIVVRDMVATSAPDAGAAARLFPNPSSSECWLEVELDYPESVEARIRNLAGQPAVGAIEYYGAPGANRWLLPDLPEGLYFVVVRTSRGSAVLRWVKAGRP